MWNELVARAEREKHRFVADASDLITELIDESQELRGRVAYVESVLSRDPFDDTQRAFAAKLLRDALYADATPAKEPS